MENRKAVKRKERDYVMKLEEDSDDEDELNETGTATSQQSSPKRGRGAYDNMSMSQYSPTRSIAKQTMRTHFTGQQSTTDTVLTGQTGFLSTQRPGGLADLLKMPDLSNLPKNQNRGGGGGLS